MRDYQITASRKQSMLEFYAETDSNTTEAVKLALTWIEADPKLLRECLWRGAYAWMLDALNQERKAIFAASVRALAEPEPAEPSNAVKVLRSRHIYDPRLNSRHIIENIFNSPMPRTGKLLGDCTREDLAEEIASLKTQAEEMTDSALRYHRLWDRMEPGKTVRQCFKARDVASLISPKRAA